MSNKDTALKALIKYAEWQIEEGTDYHPTLPSAIEQGKAALQSHDGAEVDETIEMCCPNCGLNFVFKETPPEPAQGDDVKTHIRISGELSDEIIIQNEVISDLNNALKAMPKFCAYHDEYGEDFDFDGYQKDITEWGITTSNIKIKHTKALTQAQPVNVNRLLKKYIEPEEGNDKEPWYTENEIHAYNMGIKNMYEQGYLKTPDEPVDVEALKKEVVTSLVNEYKAFWIRREGTTRRFDEAATVSTISSTIDHLNATGRLK